MRHTRNYILFVVGTAGVLYEMSGPLSPPLLMLFGMMIGLPFMLRSDEQRGERQIRPDMPKPALEPSTAPVSIQVLEHQAFDHEPDGGWNHDDLCQTCNPPVRFNTFTEFLQKKEPVHVMRPMRKHTEQTLGGDVYEVWVPDVD